MSQKVGTKSEANGAVEVREARVSKRERDDQYLHMLQKPGKLRTTN